MPIDTARFFPLDAGSLPRADRSARLLIAAGISTYGDWLTVVALSVLLFDLTRRPEAPALYILARFAPKVLGPTLGGTLADRYGPGLVAGSSALGQCVLTAAIVVFADNGTTWAIFVAVACAGFLGSVAQPALSACIPRVTAAPRLLRVNALYSGLVESSVLVAPVIGALLLPFVQPQTLVAADAASFGLAGALVLSLHVSRVDAVSSVTYGHSRAAAIVARDPMLRSLAASFFCSAAAITALQAVLVVAAAARFGQANDVGWLYAAVGAGGVAGSLVLLRWSPRTISTRGIAIGFLFEVIPLGLFAVVGGPLPALGLLFVSTAAAAQYQTRGQTALQQRVPAALLGRVNGVMRLLLYAGMLVGAVAAVVLVEPLGWTALVLGATTVALVAFVPAAITYRRGPRRPDEVTLAGTPMVLMSDQTATASRASFSIGKPTELPHSLHDPS
ncbi:MAG: MFS transporter [Candidatus Dormibacteria bacterium]